MILFSLMLTTLGLNLVRAGLKNHSIIYFTQFEFKTNRASKLEHEKQVGSTGLPPMDDFYFI